MKLTVTGLAAVAVVVIVAVPLTAETQSAGKVPRVGLVELAPEFRRHHDEFRQGLRELGYVEGKSIVVEARSAGSSRDRLRPIIDDLLRLPVDVLVTPGSFATRTAGEATRTVPIVSITGDPVAAGLAQSLARPGGNITGVTVWSGELGPKWLQLLKEAAPAVSRVGLLRSTFATGTVGTAIRRAAPSIGVTIVPIEVRSVGDFEGAFGALLRERVNGLLTEGDPLTDSQHRRIVEFAQKHGLPGVYPRRDFVDVGGLMFYGASLTDSYRRASTYVDKILRGAKPADLPIEQPTKFELVINLKAAKALRLTIPPALLIRADEVLQ